MLKEREIIMTLLKIVGSGGSKHSLHLEQPLHLDPNRDYSIGLVGFYGKNCIRNVPNYIKIALHVKDPAKGKYGDIRNCFIASGNYSIGQIKEIIMKKVKEQFPQALKQGTEGLYFLRLNPITQRVEFKLPVDVNLFPDFNDNSLNLGHMLGFLPRKDAYFPPNQTHVGESMPKMNPYKVVEIHCNLVKPTITNHNANPHSHQEADLLYMFYPVSPQSDFGSMIAHEPARVIYVPLNKSIKSVQNLELEIKNEDGRKLDFTLGGDLIVYLKLIDNALAS